jgi:hypothetical protein
VDSAIGLQSLLKRKIPKREWRSGSARDLVGNNAASNNVSKDYMIIRATLNPGTQPDNTIEVPKQTSFHTPTGQYSATIRSASKKVKQASDSTIPFVRIVFNVQVPSASLDYLAKLDVPANMNEGSDLWNIICRLLGRQALQECSGSTFDLNRLVGLSCDIEVDHVRGQQERYDFPFVIVTDLRKAGTLVKQEEK